MVLYHVLYCKYICILNFKFYFVEKVLKEPEENFTETILNGNSKTISTFAEAFKVCTDYDVKHFTSLSSFTKWLHRPVDASALGVFRMLYGKYKKLELF